MASSMSSSNCSFCSTLRNLFRSTLSSFSFCTTWFLACLSNLFKIWICNDLRKFSSTNFWCLSVKLKALLVAYEAGGGGNTHNSIWHDPFFQQTLLKIPITNGVKIGNRLKGLWPPSWIHRIPDESSNVIGLNDDVLIKWVLITFPVL